MLLVRWVTPGASTWIAYWPRDGVPSARLWLDEQYKILADVDAQIGVHRSRHNGDTLRRRIQLGWRGWRYHSLGCQRRSMKITALAGGIGLFRRSFLGYLSDARMWEPALS